MAEAPPPPPEFGGGRNILADPLSAGLSTSVGDMAALQLRFMHAMQAAVPNGQAGLFNEVAAGMRNVLAASNASQAREQATRVLQPLTRVPLDPYGINGNFAAIRMFNVPTFKGNGSDTMDVVGWISRILSLAEAHTLTFEATISLMVQGSDAGAAAYIDQMRQERKSLAQIIQQLEMRYGDLCTPEEARVKCNNMLRKEKEGLSDFIDRLRLMSRMACRYETDNDAQRAAIEVLVEGNIRRVLPASVRNALEERVINRSRMGLPAFTAREVEKECLDLEKRREERRQAQAEPVVAVKKHVRRAQVEIETSESGSETSSDDDAAEEDDGARHLIYEIRQQEKRYAAKGRYVEPQKVYRRAFRNYNQKYQGAKQPFRKRVNQQGAAQFIGAGPAAPGNANRQQGPPNYMNGPPRKTISELLALANCARGQCIQCGMDGHLMKQDMCALKDKILVDRACAKCGKGLHAADDCIRVYQQRYQAAPQPAAGNANLVQDENLNED